MNLIMHIGSGKTGTTSLQNVLLNNTDKLNEQGFHYLGLMLETAYTVKFPWQRKTTVNTDFFKMPLEQATSELYEILSDAVLEGKRRNIHTLIWSNESFFDNEKQLIEVLGRLRKEGLETKIVAYIRNHDSWAKSAYIQWGIKHKTYTGKVQSFKEWIKSHIPNFSKKILPYMNNFPGHVILRNMDTVEGKDVVKDFLTLSSIDYKDFALGNSNLNLSLGNEELLLRALFNSKYNTQVLPERFNNMFEYFNPESGTAEDFVRNLLPSIEDLKNIQDVTEEDRLQINKYFLEQSQPLLKSGAMSIAPAEIDKDKLIMILAQLLIGQSRRIDKLETRICKIEEMGAV
jgi:hypothetical protein